MAHILALTGSPTDPSRTEQLLRHVGARLSRQEGHEIRLRHLAVRDLPPAPLLGADAGHPAIRQAVAAVAEADAVIVGTPVYKAAYSGLLKTFLDVLPRAALGGKHVLPLATGGSTAHVLALDYSLRPVLTALGAGGVLRGWFVLDRDIAAEPTADAGVRLAPEAEAGIAQAVTELAGALRASDRTGVPLAV
ncbi:NADPH-dependent FMN reductase [Streptomyces albus subsp. chlorinus]|uniref:NADPH-dependent FMN reductase n=1 Tax=Streptomyces albus TaxID=1888 RepID=UPI001570A0B2|nr:NADPH-dependent FMN reductase [Streptomyces albus]NSC24488.1 NADPH-dependent FMN reductase [Streptomyces albus subsp. chlorinus]